MGARYRDYIGEGWNRDGVVTALSELPGLHVQPPDTQKPHKVSYFTTPDALTAAREALAAAELPAKLIYSQDSLADRGLLDVLPARASKGAAVRFLSEQSGVPLSHIVVAGDTGNDADMLRCGARAIAVGNYSAELKPALTDERVYTAGAHHAAGVLEGLKHYGVL